MTGGSCHEPDAAHHRLQLQVIPRLLGGIKQDGRDIEPCFIHGYLWEGNIGTQADTRRTFLFDSNGYYAHFEMEMVLWRTQHHEMHHRAYFDKYFERRLPSEPVEELDDRIVLDGLKACLMYSAHRRGHHVRQRLERSHRLPLSWPKVPKSEHC